MPADRAFEAKDFTALTGAMLDAVQHPLGGRPPLTDANEGSVVRTLIEAFARELAVAYQQLGIVYDYAYLETAVGPALDNVVALLGIERQRAGYLTGTVQFRRATATDADLTVPAGTLVAGPGVPAFATVADVVMSVGERLVAADIRAVTPGGETVAAGKLTLMPRPVAGIEQVSNPGALILRQREEIDDELRARAAQTVRGANTGTVSAIEQAVRSLGIAEVKVLEDLDRAPGVIQVVLGDAGLSDDLKELARGRVEEVRPAGVRVAVAEATRIVVQVAATLQLSDDFPIAVQGTIRAGLLQRLAGYFATLSVGESVREAKIRNILTGADQVVAIEPTAGLPMLDPRLVDGSSAASKHRLTSGDIAIGPMERAVLGDGAQGPVLTLEPLKLNVWIDALVVTTLAADLIAAAHDAAVAALNTLLGGIGKTLDQAATSGAPAAMEVTWVQLRSCLPASGVTSARFTIVHDVDGRVVELETSGDKDSFAPRERPLSRDLTLQPAHG